jgi:hypothetical protein
MKGTFLQRFSKLGFASIVSKLTKEAAEGKQITIHKLISCMAVIAALWISAPASAQTLTLDNFTCGAYVRNLNTGSTTDKHYAPLCNDSPLGTARQTFFTIGPNYYDQGATLDIGKGIWILDAGFGTVGGVDVGYGFTTSGVETPLNLDLGGYSGFQLNFAGVATSEDLGVIIAVFLHNGGAYVSGLPNALPPYANPISIEYPFSGFSKPGGLTQADVSDISYIVIEAYGGGYASYGITSFQAYK